MPPARAATATKPPTLRSVLRGLGGLMKEESNQIRTTQIIVKAAVMSIAAILAENPYRKEIGVKLTHGRLITQATRNIWTMGRRDYGALSKEIRRLLTHGPQRYYQEAAAEIVALYPNEG